MSDSQEIKQNFKNFVQWKHFPISNFVILKIIAALKSYLGLQTVCLGAPLP